MNAEGLRVHAERQGHGAIWCEHGLGVLCACAQAQQARGSGGGSDDAREVELRALRQELAAQEAAVAEARRLTEHVRHADLVLYLRSVEICWGHMMHAGG